MYYKVIGCVTDFGAACEFKDDETLMSVYKIEECLVSMHHQSFDVSQTFVRN